MSSKELKVGEAIANAVEDHWFNPATIGRYLADQPYYTIDRILEMVTWIIEKQARRHELELVAGDSSEGLFLAYEIDKHIDKLKKQYVLDNVKLP